MNSASGRQKVSIVFADMDGTFLATNKSVPSGNMRMLDDLADRGIPFVPCTGRPVSGVPREVLEHPATLFAVGSNGAVVFDVRNSRRIHVERMDKRKVLALYERVRAEELHATFDVFADGEVLAERGRYEAMGSYGIDEPTLAVLRQVRKPVDFLVPRIVERAECVEKVTCFWRAKEDRRALSRAIDAIGGFTVAHGHPKNFELQAKGVSKGSALLWLCDYAGVPVEESVAFGDETNDIPLLKAAGVAVAMANAVGGVLAVADHIAATNDDAGVAQYVARQLACEGA